MLSVITTLEFFQHYFAKMGHRNTSCDPHLHPNHQATNAPLPHAKRPPPGGYVLTLKSEKKRMSGTTNRDLTRLCVIMLVQCPILGSHPSLQSFFFLLRQWASFSWLCRQHSCAT